MKNIILLSLVILIGMTGCVTSKLVSLETEGLLPKQPIRITDSASIKSITFRGQISRSDRESLSYFNQLPEGDSTSLSHFTYKFPRYQLNAEIEGSVSSNIAFLAGFNLSKVEGKEYFGGHIGTAIYSFSGSNVLRFDIGAKFQKMNSDLVYSNTTERWMRSDLIEIIKTNKNSNYANLYTGVTFNGNNKDAFANFFFSYMLLYQTFFNYEGTIFSEGFNLTEHIHSISLGLFKNINTSGRVILGARVTHYSFEFYDSTPFDLFLQYDFIL